MLQLFTSVPSTCHHHPQETANIHLLLGTQYRLRKSIVIYYEARYAEFSVYIYSLCGAGPSSRAV
jgi:hypothetical protein